MTEQKKGRTRTNPSTFYRSSLVHNSCGYAGHVCSSEVRFISRYRNENDYCVDGIRITVPDSGTPHEHGSPVKPDVLSRILFYELAKYADYLKWHSEMRLVHGSSMPSLSPFEFTHLLTPASPTEIGGKSEPRAGRRFLDHNGRKLTVMRADSNVEYIRDGEQVSRLCSIEWFNSENYKPL